MVIPEVHASGQCKGPKLNVLQCVNLTHPWAADLEGNEKRQQKERRGLSVVARSVVFTLMKWELE
jgi:hypothetical protein